MEVFLHRVLDALMFRVLPTPDAVSNGMVDFCVEPGILLSTNAISA